MYHFLRTVRVYGHVLLPGYAIVAINAQCYVPVSVPNMGGGEPLLDPFTSSAGSIVVFEDEDSALEYLQAVAGKDIHGA